MIVTMIKKVKKKVKSSFAKQNNKVNASFVSRVMFSSDFFQEGFLTSIFIFPLNSF